jgi:predicted nucleotidyltransferase component of viral defense system
MLTMLTQQQAQQFALENQTIVDNILKEHYQIYILDQLYKSNFGNNLVFKGGTALKLAYNSIRFSEDLDFSVLGKIDYSDFKKTVQSMVNKFSESKIQDIYDKYNTLYAKIVFKVGFKPIPIGIKIEINKNKGKINFQHSIKLLKSQFNNIEVLASTFTLEAILKDKMGILKKETRRQPRDLFDAWYICQKLNKKFEIKDENKYSKKELMNGLNPLLPKNYQKVMGLFEK